MSIDDFAQIRLPVEGRDVQLCQESLGAVATVTQCSWQQRQKNKSGGFFLIDIYIHTDATLVVAPHCNDSTQHHVARGEHTSAHDHGSLYLAEFSTDFRAVFMIHVLKRLIMLKITLQSGSCFFVTLCCKKQQDYSIALTCLLSCQSLTWKERCRWASVGLSLTPAVCLYSVGLFKQNKSHLKQLCRFL